MLGWGELRVTFREWEWWCSVRVGGVLGSGSGGGVVLGWG